jgi:phosphatidylserine/phosphatidylglycerophosphate/cardiolipin synthase-like enzyme
VYASLGSANVNTRSMEVDSELNICVEDPAVVKPLRKQLWGMHTGGKGAGDDIQEAFYKWSYDADVNATRRADPETSKVPISSLTEFRRDSANRTYKD